MCDSRLRVGTGKKLLKIEVRVRDKRWRTELVAALQPLDAELPGVSALVISVVEGGGFGNLAKRFRARNHQTRRKRKRNVRKSNDKRPVARGGGPEIQRRPTNFNPTPPWAPFACWDPRRRGFAAAVRDEAFEAYLAENELTVKETASGGEFKMSAEKMRSLRANRLRIVGGTLKGPLPEATVSEVENLNKCCFKHRGLRALADTSAFFFGEHSARGFGAKISKLKTSNLQHAVELLTKRCVSISTLEEEYKKFARFVRDLETEAIEACSSAKNIARQSMCTYRVVNKLESVGGDDLGGLCGVREAGQAAGPRAPTHSAHPFFAKMKQTWKPLQERRRFSPQRQEEMRQKATVIEDNPFGEHVVSDELRWIFQVKLGAHLSAPSAKICGDYNAPGASQSASRAKLRGAKLWKSIARGKNRGRVLKEFPHLFLFLFRLAAYPVMETPCESYGAPLTFYNRKNLAVRATRIYCKAFLRATGIRGDDVDRNFCKKIYVGLGKECLTWDPTGLPRAELKRMEACPSWRDLEDGNEILGLPTIAEETAEEAGPHAEQPNPANSLLADAEPSRVSKKVVFREGEETWERDGFTQQYREARAKAETRNRWECGMVAESNATHDSVLAAGRLEGAAPVKKSRS